MKTVDVSRVVNAAAELQSELNLLYKRFCRESVQIAMIGRERQGKSTIIQQITNLSNDVIPAFDGSSCTGAISIIHNYNGPFKVDLTFFDRSEFVSVINDKLNRYFPEKGLRISSPEQIPSLLSHLDGTMSSDALKFKQDYIEHYVDYCTLVGAVPTTLSDESIVAQYVAQYQLFERRNLAPDGYEVIETPTKDGKGVLYKALYYKYLAVKTANIFKQFEYQDSGKLVLVDTIGIGPKDDGSIRKQMFKVVREDCDGVIDIFRPDSLGNSIDDKQTEILEDLYREFSDRLIEKWFVYVINEVQDGDGRNMHLTPQLLEEAKQMSNGEKTKFAWATKVNGKNQNEVIQELVIPLLQQIVDNLDIIDDTMMDKAQQKADILYNEYLILCKSADAVLTSALRSDQNARRLFDGLYKNLSMVTSMTALDVQKAGEEDLPCHEIAERLKTITENEIYDTLPDDDEVLKNILNGADGAPLFVEEINELRNRIAALYESISIEQLYPLQEKLKMQIIDILYNDGLLKNIPLAGCITEEGPSPNWLSALIEETVPEGVYPHLHNALQSILDYQINIEGLIEYNVAKSLRCINPQRREFTVIPFIPLPVIGTQPEERASQITNELFNRIGHIQLEVRKWINDFAMIPSHSFYARVHKVYERLFKSKDCIVDLEYYYWDNMALIWRDDIKVNEQIKNAFGEWNSKCHELNLLADKNNYII